jgi:hypothetical protein
MRMRTLRVRVDFTPDGKQRIEEILKDHITGSPTPQIGLFIDFRFDRWFARPSRNVDGTYILFYQPLRGGGCRTMVARVRAEELEIPQFIVELYDDCVWILQISVARLISRVRGILEEEHLVSV